LGSAYSVSAGGTLITGNLFTGSVNAGSTGKKSSGAKTSPTESSNSSKSAYTVSALPSPVPGDGSGSAGGNGGNGGVNGSGGANGSGGGSGTTAFATNGSGTNSNGKAVPGINGKKQSLSAALLANDDDDLPDEMFAWPRSGLIKGIYKEFYRNFKRIS
jgi:hypothetical protein